MFSKIWRDVGLISNEIPGAICCPATISAAIAKSLRPGFADEPIIV